MESKLSRVELIELVRRVMSADDTEEDIQQMLSTVEANVPHPEVSNLIFYPNSDDPTPEQVVEEALAYRPIVLDPPAS